MPRTPTATASSSIATRPRMLSEGSAGGPCVLGAAAGFLISLASMPKITVGSGKATTNMPVALNVNALSGSVPTIIPRPMAHWPRWGANLSSYGMSRNYLISRPTGSLPKPDGSALAPLDTNNPMKPKMPRPVAPSGIPTGSTSPRAIVR